MPSQNKSGISVSKETATAVSKIGKEFGVPRTKLLEQFLIDSMKNGSLNDFALLLNKEKQRQKSEKSKITRYIKALKEYGCAGIIDKPDGSSITF